MTTAEARKAGYQVTRDGYAPYRWYVDSVASTYWDRRGAGYRTRRDALDALAEHLGV